VLITDVSNENTHTRLEEERERRPGNMVRTLSAESQASPARESDPESDQDQNREQETEIQTIGENSRGLLFSKEGYVGQERERANTRSETQVRLTEMKSHP